MDKLEKLRQANIAYYAGKPTMTDDEFDTLEAELIASGIDTLSIRMPRETRLGNRYPMGTLQKRSLKDTLDFIQEYETRIEPKFDGVAMELLYDIDGNFFKAEGRSGTDYTFVVSQFLDKALLNGEAPLYGEVVIPKTTDLPLKYKNRRNAVAGILQSNDPLQEDIELLRFIEYAKGGAKGLQPTGVFEKAYGPHNEDSLLDIKAFFDQTVDADLDGIVLKAYHQSDRDAFSENNKAWQFCYKFQDELHETTVRSISWQVSSNGKVTPVAHFDTVDDELGSFSKATVASLRKLEEMQVSVGGKVLVKRANKVIPHISGVISPGVQTNIPDVIEGRRTFRKGAHLYVKTRMYDNPLMTIKHQVAMLGAKHITSTKINKAIEDDAKDIFDFYAWLEKQGDIKTLDKLSTLWNMRTAGQWLMFLNIGGISSGKISAIDTAYGNDFVALARLYSARAISPRHPSVVTKTYFTPSVESALLENNDIILDFAIKRQQAFERHVNGTLSI